MSEKEREFNLNDFFRLLRNRAAIVIGFTIIIGVFLSFVALAAYPVYEANGTIQITAEQGGLGVVGEFFTLGGGSSQINSEVEIIRSRSIALDVIDELDLNLSVEDATYGGSITRAVMFVFGDRLKRQLRMLRVDEVEFPPTSIDKTYTLTFTDDSGNFRVSGPEGDLGTGHQGEPFVSDELTFTAMVMKGPGGTKFRLTPRSAHETLRTFRQRLEAAPLGGATRTNLITITYRDSESTLAADVVNEVISEYDRRDIQWRTNMGRTQTEQLESRLADALTDLQDAEDALEAYKNEFGVVNLPDEARLLVSDLADREAERVDVDLRLSLLRNIHTSLAASMDSDTFAVPPSLTSDSVIQNLAAEHSRHMAELESLLIDYTESHPAVIAKRETIRQVRENILEALGATISGLVEQRMDLGEVIGELESRLYAVPGAERDLLELTRNLDVADEAYRLLLRRLEEAKLVEASFLVGNRIIDEAVPPDRPVSPSIKRNLAMGLGLGLVLGILIAFLVEISDLRLRRPEQLADLLGTKPLAVVDRGDDQEIVRASSVLALAMMKAEKPSLALACTGIETPRMRASLERVISSLSAGVGQILLVDTSGSETGFFGTATSPGISDIGRGADVIPHRVDGEGILVLPAGEMPSTTNAADPRIRERIAAMQNEVSLTLFYLGSIVREPALRGWTGMTSGAVLLAQMNRDHQSEIVAIYEALVEDEVSVLAGIAF